MHNFTIYLTKGRLLMPCLAIAVCILFFATTARAQPAIALSNVINSGLSQPIQFVNAGDGSNRVFIVEKGGAIKAYDASFNFLSTFLTVTNILTDGERGLLSLAFHPNYQSNGLFYVYYTNSAGDLQLARYHVSEDENLADPSSKDTLITIPHPTNANHNGGELHFGPDGFLYLSTGDGGGGGDVPNNAQNTAVLLGKMLRFDVDESEVKPYYSIPAGNPYGNEIFDLGLRNPYRWSFDRQTGDMWIGDVGQDSFEEINFRAAGTTGGVNYGWRCYEGDNTYNTAGCQPIANYVFPAFAYPSQNPSAAVTGGIVYRGADYPALQGYNYTADFYSGIFYKTFPDGNGGFTTTTQVLAPTGIVDFGETETGEAYVVSLTGNSVYRLIQSGPLPVTLVGLTGTATANGIKLSWQTSQEINIDKFEIEYSSNGTSFATAGVAAPKNSANGASYTFLHAINYSGNVYYRLKITDRNGSYKYSDIIKVLLSNKPKNLVAPSIITNGILNVNLDVNQSAFHSLQLISVNGNIVLQKNIAGQTGNLKIPVSTIATGIYSVRLTGNAQAIIEKVLIK